VAVTGVLANLGVSDLAQAERWYALVLGGPPAARPMEGLLEWNLVAGGGVQVWREPARAGGSGCVLAVDDLDDVAGRLAAAGVAHDGPQPGGGARLLVLADPDGNRVVLTGA
jgi:catechol 2,3-dioxygenase-like lactoylglutathione lyase family enzyme